MTQDTSKTLEAALKETWQNKWKHLRSGKTLLSQAEIAIKGCAYFYVYPSRCMTVGEVSSEVIHKATAYWYTQGVSPATITKRLNCLSVLGVNVEGCRVKVPKPLKWHLREDQLEEVMEFAQKNCWPGMAFFILWTTRTGLRIEESLRAHWADLGSVMVAGTLTVNGTKTSSSQATLPLSSELCKELVKFRKVLPKMENGFIFPVSYERLHDDWELIRKHFGWQDTPTATLKALRRSAARYLHIDCGMPLDMVRQYLRHENIQTTMEYLRLTGGYGTEEMRRFLK